MSRLWVRVLWWFSLVASIGAVAFSGRLEVVTGLPVGPGSLVFLLVFAGWRAVDWYVSRQEHPVHPMAPTGPEPQTVRMALKRVVARRAKAGDAAQAAAARQGSGSRASQNLQV